MQALDWNPDRWRQRFFLLWGGQALSLVGSRLVQFALVWWLTKLTDSAAVLATASMMAYLPQVFISPLAGALVDRWNRRTVMIIADGSIALATVALAVLFVLGRVEPWHVYAIMFVRSLGGAFHWPAMQASTTLMVPKEHLARIAGLNQTLRGIAMVAAPPLGALLIEALPVQGVLGIDVVTAAIAILPLLVLRIPQPVAAVAAGARSVFRGMVEGFSFAWKWPGMLMLIGALALMNFVVNPAFALLALYVRRVLGGEAIHLGTLQALFGFAFVLGGALLAAWGGFKSKVRTALLAVGVMGFAIIGLGVVPHGAFYVVAACLFLCGFMEPIANGSFVATMQASVPEELQGRVFSLLGSATQLVVPFGLGLAGFLVERHGIQLWFLIGGIAYLFVGFGCMLVPAIMGLEKQGEKLKADALHAALEPAIDE